MTTMTTRPDGRFAPSLDTLRSRLAAARADFAAWQARRPLYLQTLNELSSLTDRDLSDLGIARCDIPRIARDASQGT